MQLVSNGSANSSIKSSASVTAFKQVVILPILTFFRRTSRLLLASWVVTRKLLCLIFALLFSTSSSIFLTFVRVLIRFLEIVLCFGSDVTKSSLQNQVQNSARGFIKQNIDAINAARAQGLDLKDVTLPSLRKGGASGSKSQKILSPFFFCKSI